MDIVAKIIERLQDNLKCTPGATELDKAKRSAYTDSIVIIQQFVRELSPVSSAAENVDNDPINELAKDFIESELKKGFLGTTSEFMTLFLHSMIEEGKVVTMEEYEVCDRLRGEYYRELDKLKSTVSSAGKEVKTNKWFKDFIADRDYKSTFSMAKMFIKLHQLIDLQDEAAEMYANQFKSSPASTGIPEISDTDIEAQALKMYKPELGTHNLMVELGKWVREQLKSKS